MSVEPDEPDKQIFAASSRVADGPQAEAKFHRWRVTPLVRGSSDSHSINSSAMASTVCGTSRPSALAV
jgi:hypothetical protein